MSEVTDRHHKAADVFIEQWGRDHMDGTWSLKPWPDVAYAHGLADAEARIVAWLRAREDSIDCEWLADDIESGNHWEQDDG